MERWTGCDSEGCDCGDCEVEERGTVDIGKEERDCLEEDKGIDCVG